MACEGRFTQRDLNERRADAALATVGRDRERSEQQRRRSEVLLKRIGP
jgi:hypothetical protein